MRAILYSLLSLATIANTLAVGPRDAAKDDDWDEKEDVVPDTTFNGQAVPPMRQLGTDLNEAISKGNWLVEYYSPSCSHCRRMMPVWQTLYEFYYTSKPPITTSSENDQDGLNSFTRYYDFKIAKVDCIAFRDACIEHGIESYPSIIHYKDGKEGEKKVGEQKLKTLSHWVEEILETIRPGSRVQGGPKLPKVGADSVETGPDTEGEVKKQIKEHKEAEAEAQPSKAPEPTKVAKPAPAKPTSTPNVSGVSVAFDADLFQEQVTNSLDPWFIKFYAPWCHHCQAMGPNWIQMAREMKGKLNVGEVDCDANKKLCKDIGVKGYPTVLLFRGNERTEYQGMRGLGDFVDYADKAAAIGQGVVDVDAESFKKMEETEDVIFVYFYDHATTTEDFQALERLTLSLVGKARLVKTDDKALGERFKISTWPTMMVSRDGKPTYYGQRTPKDMRDSQKTLSWMKSVWTPIVTELRSDNAREIMDGKLVVLAVLDKENANGLETARRELKNAALEWLDKEEQMYQLERQELRDAKKLRIEEAEDKNDQKALRAAKGMRIDSKDLKRKQVAFAWVDGVFWERWIRTTFGIDVKDGERVIINDEDNHRYWDVSASGEPIRASRTSIHDTLREVTKNPPSISPKSTAGFFTGIWLSVSSHPFLTLAFLIGIVVAATMVTNRRKRRGYYFPSVEKEGLLGGRGLGKND